MIAILLLAIVARMAGPSAVWHLIRSTDGRLLAAALVTSAAFLTLRGLRLRLLLESGGLGWLTAILVAAAAQAAALFAPARLGELALPWLLTRATGRSFSANVGTLLAARVLDLATLGVWCGAAILAIRGLKEPIALASRPPLACTDSPASEDVAGGRSPRHPVAGAARVERPSMGASAAEGAEGDRLVALATGQAVGGTDRRRF